MSIKDKDQISSKHIILLLMFVVFGCIANWIIVPYFYGCPTSPADFGDMFGAINALFSGLAFVGVIVAILLQKNELKLQREELENTREELKGQKLQLEAQNYTMHKQSFESTFFNLIDLHNNIVYNITVDTNLGSPTPISLRSSISTVNGRDAFKSIYNYFVNIVLNANHDNDNATDILYISNLSNTTFIKIYNRIEPYLGHYYRTIHNILEYINASNIHMKEFYADILKAQLSSHELLLLHYFSLTEKCPEDFRKLINMFKLLSFVPKYELIESAYTRRVERTSAIKKNVDKSP